ncbi:MAG: hypothetical protein GC191_21065 [Azospirillum sp.]|nr:hypothetical protein [Azospirillum sp.]
MPKYRHLRVHHLPDRSTPTRPLPIHLRRRRTNFTGADFTGAELSGADLAGARIDGATGLASPTRRLATGPAG